MQILIQCMHPQTKLCILSKSPHLPFLLRIKCPRNLPNNLLLLWRAQFQESKRYKFSSYLGPDSRGEGFQYLEESVWREKYIFMEQTIKLYHHASRIKSSIQTKISQFYFPTSVYSCRQLPSACNLEFQMRVALVTIKIIETQNLILRFLTLQSSPFIFTKLYFPKVSNLVSCAEHVGASFRIYIYEI